MQKTVILFCVLFFSFNPASFSQSSKIDKQYLQSYWSDTKTLFHAPARWEIADWWKASVLLGSVYLITTRDGQINDFFQRNKSSATESLSDVVQPLGNELAVLGIESAWLGYGILAKKEKAKQLALLSIKTTLISGAVVFSVKHLTHRTRPWQFHDPNDWNGPFAEREYTSFFSGHATFSFGLATIIACSTKNKLLKVSSYSLAAVIALSRIHDEKHWASDVVTGAIIGTVIAQTICKNNCGNIEVSPAGIRVKF